MPGNGHKAGIMSKGNMKKERWILDDHQQGAGRSSKKLPKKKSGENPRRRKFPKRDNEQLEAK